MLLLFVWVLCCSLLWGERCGTVPVLIELWWSNHCAWQHLLLTVVNGCGCSCHCIVICCLAWVFAAVCCWSCELVDCCWLSLIAGFGDDVVVLLMSLPLPLLWWSCNQWPVARKSPWRIRDSRSIYSWMLMTGWLVSFCLLNGGCLFLCWDWLARCWIDWWLMQH